MKNGASLFYRIFISLVICSTSAVFGQNKPDDKINICVKDYDWKAEEIVHNESVTRNISPPELIIVQKGQEINTVQYAECNKAFGLKNPFINFTQNAADKLAERRKAIIMDWRKNSPPPGVLDNRYRKMIPKGCTPEVMDLRFEHVGTTKHCESFLQSLSTHYSVVGKTIEIIDGIEFEFYTVNAVTYYYTGRLQLEHYKSLTYSCKGKSCYEEEEEEDQREDEDGTDEKADDDNSNDTEEDEGNETDENEEDEEEDNESGIDEEEEDEINNEELCEMAIYVSIPVPCDNIDEELNCTTEEWYTEWVPCEEMDDYPEYEEEIENNEELCEIEVFIPVPCIDPDADPDCIMMEPYVEWVHCEDAGDNENIQFSRKGHFRAFQRAPSIDQQEIIESEIKIIYASDRIVVQNSPPSALLTVTNSLGQRVVYQQLAGDQVYVMPTTDFVPGIYFVTVKGNNSFEAKKLYINQ